VWMAACWLAGPPGCFVSLLVATCCAITVTQTPPPPDTHTNPTDSLQPTTHSKPTHAHTHTSLVSIGYCMHCHDVCHPNPPPLVRTILASSKHQQTSPASFEDCQMEAAKQQPLPPCVDERYDCSAASL